MSVGQDPSEFETLVVPAVLDDAKARRYCPIAVIGGDLDETSDPIGEFVAAYPALADYHARHVGTLDMFVSHAHAIRVSELEQRRFAFSPHIPMLRFPGGDLVVGSPLEFRIADAPTDSRPGETAEWAGLMVVLAVVNNIAIEPDNDLVARRLRRLVDQLFSPEGVGVPRGLRVRAGENLSALHVHQLYRTLVEAEYERTQIRIPKTSLPTESGGTIEIPRTGSILVLGADGTPTGIERLRCIVAELRGHGRNALLVRDHDEILGHNVAQKAIAMAMACEAVLVDDTEPSGHLVEVSPLLINSTIPFVLLRPNSRASTAMIEPHIAAYQWARVVPYETSPADAITTALKAARELNAAKQESTRATEWWR